MTQTTAPPTPTPTHDPIHAALDDPAIRGRLRGHALVQLGAWLQGSRSARRHEEADEIIAETFQRAWGARAKYDPARSAIGWLHGILTNVLREYARRLGRQPQPLANVDIPGPEVLAHVEDRELLARVMDRLSPDERNLIVWSLFEGQSHQQIAERLQITEGNARVRLSRALQKLRRQLQKEGER